MGDALWVWYKNRAEDPMSRRNAVVAFLYARPDQDSRRIADVTIADAEFGRLAFERGRMVDVSWARSTVRRLELTDPSWDRVGFVDSHVSSLVVNRVLRAGWW